MPGDGAARQMGLEQALNEARSLHASGRLNQAAAFYRQILAQLPDQPTALGLLGVIALQQNDPASAVKLIGRAAIIEPGNADAWGNLGIALHRAGKLEDGLATLERSLQFAPANISFLFARSTLLADLGRPEEALVAYDRVLARDPKYFPALLNRANLLFRMSRFDQAIEGFKVAVSVKPEDPRCRNNLAVSLRAAGRLAEALAAFEQVLAKDPRFPTAETGRGIVLAEMARYQEAIVAFDRALVIDAKDFGAHFNRGLALLSLSRWREAWSEYEFRWLLDDNPSKPRGFAEPEWDGSKLNQQRLLLHAEQGAGDSIHFLRYAALAKARGATVIVECQPALKRLFQRSPGIDFLLARGEPLPPFDLHAPFMSLPRLFGTTVSTIPSIAGYVISDPRDVEGRGRQLAQLRRPRVGILWQGNLGNKSLRTRSTELPLWTALLQQANISFVSLQVDPGRVQLADIAQAYRPFDPFGAAPPRDFADTAAVIANLDLVITIDTSVAHLAGAMAKPVWVLLPFAADWRWLGEREDSPWYPTMRLFRQRRAGDWAEVMERVGNALLAYVHGGN
jgi:tetratricopeptide (TPR) repeat protein